MGLVAPAAGQGLVSLLPPAVGVYVHPVFVSENVLALIAFGLVAGQSGCVRWRWTVPAFVFGIAAACALASAGPVPLWLWSLSLLFALWLGLVAAAVLEVPAAVIALLGCGVGVATGLDIVPLGRVSPWDLAARALAAVGVMMIVWAAVAALAARLRAHWQQIGIRVAGAWISAISAMLLALRFAL